MAYRVTNRSRRVVPLIDRANDNQQINLQPGKSVVVEAVTTEIFNLSDPSKGILKVEEVPKEVKETTPKKGGNK